ncbi:MAG: hypothetical protein J6Q31_02265 [Alistipes sp.]|jgi:hypothetical protein|nr:hypothetical protein [Alistipes sp.]
MKKLILAAIFCLFAVTTFAQNNALGLRIGSGAELQYDHTFGSGNVLKTNVGLFDFNGSLFGTCIYDWEVCNWADWTPDAGNWFLQAGVGGAVGIVKTENVSDFNIGVAGNVAFGIHFCDAPVTLAIDYRPTIFLLNNSWGSGFGSAGLSCVVHF